MKEKHTSKALKGHFDKAGTTPKRKLVEFKADFPKELKLGDTVTVSDLSEGVEWVDRQTPSPWFYGCILLAFKSIQGYENGRPHGR